jgi:hypothetical protein
MNVGRPHYTWKEAIKIMSNELTQANTPKVPDWMRAKSTGASIGNIDASDLKPPRLKLLAGMSPEVMEGTPGAVPGNFWLTVFNLNLGTYVVGTPILIRKSYQLWAPKMAGSEQKGPLATASDGINWDVPNQTFEVRFPPAMGGGTEIWKILRTVQENSLHKFGSSRPSDPKSKPAATLTYDMLWVIDLPNTGKQLCVFTAARTGTTPVQNFISTAKAMGVDQFYQRYRIIQQKKPGPSGDPYFTFEFQYLGNLTDEADGDAMHGMYEQYRKSGFVTDLTDEAADIKTERETVGTRRDVPAKDDDEIPF